MPRSGELEMSNLVTLITQSASTAKNIPFCHKVRSKSLTLYMKFIFTWLLGVHLTLNAFDIEVQQGLN